MLLHAWVVGKIKARVCSPYLFCHYMGSQQVNSKLMDPATHKAWVVSAAKLLPMHPGSQQLRL